MEIKHLQYFMEVTRTGNFTHTAENLYITQPALSRIIKSLEDELGAPLFIRSRKKLKLTEAGQVLYKHAQEIENQVQLMETDLDRLLTLKKGHIRIGLPTIINSFFFSDLIGSFHQEYPEVTFGLEEDGSKLIEDKIVHGQLDFGVIVLPKKHDSYDYYTFVNERLRLVIPSSHHLVGKQKVSLHELKGEAFIMFNQDFSLRNRILTACNDTGFQPRIISETSQLDFIEEMVASNLGITLLPESTSLKLTSQIQTIAVVNPSIEWNLAMIWKNDAYLSQTNKEFIRFAKERLKTLP
ncbi:LysR family transcriptional regulator [Virgibacillus phasianinus]|uniref:LysR family transcriptional regulator n=1 Tax=Virgibacillus phasianinus TaxID=2017483 RepID=A0A220U0S4_9BACI|nr:LysR family transcriptional regulator [Virgibacillus phasianinus]ASK61844.1 LysR family transcriptional regulator [Virgibacillus phasianinus]